MLDYIAFDFGRKLFSNSQNVPAALLELAEYTCVLELDVHRDGAVRRTGGN